MRVIIQHKKRFCVPEKKSVWAYLCVMPHLKALTHVHRLSVTLTGLPVARFVSTAAAVSLIGSNFGWHSLFVCFICSYLSLGGTHGVAIATRSVNQSIMVWSVISACHLHTQLELSSHPETQSPWVKSLRILNPIVSFDYLTSIMLELVIFTRITTSEYIFYNYYYFYSTIAIVTKGIRDWM